MWTTGTLCVAAGGMLTTMPDAERQQPATPRPTATRFSLTLDETAARFADAGLPRNIRSLQRYCAAGRLDCIKEETVTGLAYFVDPESVDKAIVQLAQLHGITDDVRHSAPASDVSHIVAPVVEPKESIDTPRATATDRDKDPKETSERRTPLQPDTSRFVAHLENENSMLRDQVVFLREQVGVKDTQIAALLERDKETNYLVRGLQTMLAPLLGRGADAHGSPQAGETIRNEDQAA